jgi:hypothetical protein
MVKSPPHFKVGNLNPNIVGRLESRPKSARTVHFTNRIELVIIITILKNSATAVKAFLTQKEESFHGTVQLKATGAPKRSKKGEVVVACSRRQPGKHFRAQLDIKIYSFVHVLAWRKEQSVIGYKVIMAPEQPNDGRKST